MSITIEKDRIIFERRDELTVFEPYGPDCIRCRMRTGRFCRQRKEHVSP